MWKSGTLESSLHARALPGLSEGARLGPSALEALVPVLLPRSFLDFSQDLGPPSAHLRPCLSASDRPQSSLRSRGRRRETRLRSPCTGPYRLMAGAGFHGGSLAPPPPLIWSLSPFPLLSLLPWVPPGLGTRPLTPSPLTPSPSPSQTAMAEFRRLRLVTMCKAFQV